MELRAQMATVFSQGPVLFASLAAYQALPSIRLVKQLGDFSELYSEREYQRIDHREVVHALSAKQCQPVLR